MGSGWSQMLKRFNPTAAATERADNEREQERFSTTVAAAECADKLTELAAELAAAEATAKLATSKVTKAAAELAAAEAAATLAASKVTKAAAKLAAARLAAAVPKLLDVPWRNFDWTSKKKKELMEFVRGYKPMVKGVEQARILLVGPVGDGKSSFYHSINKIFQGHVINQDSAGSDKDSLNTKFRSYTIKDGREGRPLPFVMCDTMGLEAESGRGIHLDDITSILNGHIEDGYSFNPAMPLQPGSPKYRENPTLGDKVHCLVYILDSSNIAQTKAKDRLPEIQRWVNQIDVPQLLIMTKVDTACSHVERNIENVYRSPHILKKMQEMALLLGIPMNCIIPVKNYSHELDTEQNVDMLLLSALQQMLRFSNGYFNNIQTRGRQPAAPEPHAAL